MEALLWSDYLCPWCYLGRDRTALLVELGVGVTHLPFELHPEIAPGGLAVRVGGRLDALHARIAAECEQAGLAFRAPTHVPNTRMALELAEVVRHRWPASFAAFDASLFDAHFVHGRDIGDDEVLDDLVARAGAPVSEVRAATADGAGARWVEDAMALAREHGVAATPAWLVDERLLIPGAQPREVIERWVTRLATRDREPR